MTELKNWYGVVTGVKFKSHGPVSDPGLIYNGREFNYWDIEGAIYDMYRDDLRDQFPDDEYLVQIDFDPSPDENDEHFTDWLAGNVDLIHGYLNDCIASGYFGDDHDLD